MTGLRRHSGGYQSSKVVDEAWQALVTNSVLEAHRMNSPNTFCTIEGVQIEKVETMNCRFAAKEAGPFDVRKQLVPTGAPRIRHQTH